MDLSDLYQAMQERATKIFAKFVKEKKFLLLKAGWFDQEISSFVNFHLVNCTLMIDIFSPEWQLLYPDKMG